MLWQPIYEQKAFQRGWNSSYSVHLGSVRFAQSTMEMIMKKFITIAMSAALASVMLIASADQSFARSRSTQCKVFAKRQADHMVNQSVGTGLALGAGTGLLIGGLSNGKKGLVPGLAFGAIGGSIVGAISGTEKRKRVFRAAYADCMNNY
jgi:hypothetical protein